MTITPTQLADCYVLEPEVFKDERGCFFESYNSKNFNKSTGLNITFVQDNESFSSKGTLRGLHYQIGKYAQSKLIRVVNGQILDVVIDLRPQSKSYGMYCSLILSELNKKQLFIPKGFAHGFLALEDDTIVNYKCDNYYNKNAEAGIVYNDKTLNINWGKHDFDFLLSEKDKHHPTFENARF